MNTSFKIIVFLLTFHTGFAATYVSGPTPGSGRYLGANNEDSPAPFSEQDLMLLTDRIARLKNVRRVVSRTGYGSHMMEMPPALKGTQVEIPHPKAVKPIEVLSTNNVHHIESVEELEQDIVIVSECDSHFSQAKDARHSAFFSSLKLFNIASKNAKVQGFVKLLPDHFHRDRLGPILSIISMKLFPRKKETEVQSFVKLSPGYSHVAAPAFSKRGDTRLFSFRRRA